MCLRYALTSSPELVRTTFGYVDEDSFPPRYNIAPTQPIAVVRRHGPNRVSQLVRWGFIPAFVKDFGAYKPVFNAGCEAVWDRPSFRNAFRRRRCLVPADGFYIWQKQGGPSQPFLFRRTDGRPFGLAGLAETWLGADGSELDTACIVTAPAAAVFASVAPRSPVVIPHDIFEAWLNPDELRAGEALALLRPAHPDEFEAVPIGPRVGAVANDEPDIQQPTGPPLGRVGREPRQGELF